MSVARSARVRLGAARRRLTITDRSIERRLVWIFGSPRSGSTWLLRLLADHPRVVPVNEPLIGLHLGPMLHDVIDIEVDMSALDWTDFMVRTARANHADEFFAEEYRDVWLPAVGDLLRKRFAEHARRHPKPLPGAPIVAIQEPNGSQSADVIMAALPRATLVFLLRDGRDVVDSVIAAAQPGTWVSQTFPGLGSIPEAGRRDFVERTARKWLWRTEVVQATFASHPGPKHLIRYEDLLADTPGQLRPLLGGIGLHADDAQLAALVERHSFESTPASERGPKGFRRAATPGLWRQNLSDDEQALLEEIMGPKLRELGYAG